MGVSIRDVDYGWADLTVGIKRLQGQAVKVGVDDRPHEPSGVPTDEIGLYHEFGRGVPERSFLRAWVDEKHGAIQTELGRWVERALEDGIDWRGPFGDWCIEQIQARMYAGIAPALSDNTKGRYNQLGIPLINTSQLVNAIVRELEGE
jgi:hypothetical protein